jgi:hypothetical protein
MFHQVFADAGTIRDHGDAKGGQFARRPDPRSQQ